MKRVTIPLILQVLLILGSGDLSATPYQGVSSVKKVSVDGEGLIALSVSSPLLKISTVLRPVENLAPVTDLSPRLFSGTSRARGGNERKIAADIIGNKLRLWTVSARGRPVVVKLSMSALTKQATLSSVAPSFPVKCGAQGDIKVKSVVSAEAPLTAAAFSPAREMQVAAMSDSKYTAKFGSGTKAQIESVMNAVNSVYMSDIGIKIKVPAVRVLPSSDTSLNTNSSESMLEEFRNKVISSPISSQADTSHLFTGRDLSGSVVGLAYLGVICFDPDFSSGLSQRTTDALDWIITAHELGHNLNAEHTGTGQGIMSPSVSSNLSNFNSTSRSQITSFVNDYGSCLTAVSNSTSKLTLSTSFSRSGTFTAKPSLTTEADPASCMIDIYGSTSKNSVGRSVVRSGLKLVSKKGELTPSFSSRIKNKASSSRTIYLAARSTCTVSGAQERLFSSVKRISVKNSDALNALRRSLR